MNVLLLSYGLLYLRSTVQATWICNQWATVWAVFRIAADCSVAKYVLICDYFLKANPKKMEPAAATQTEREHKNMANLEEFIQSDHLMVITTKNAVDATVWRRYVQVHWSKLVWKNTRYFCKYQLNYIKAEIYQ